MKKIHQIKCLPRFFDDLKSGNKTFEARLNDRDYRQGDSIKVYEFDPLDIGYTGQDFYFTAGFILYGPSYGIQEGHCIISVLPYSPD